MIRWAVFCWGPIRLPRGRLPRESRAIGSVSKPTGRPSRLQTYPVADCPQVGINYTFESCSRPARVSPHQERGHFFDAIGASPR
jgi:hypothetical protein